MFTDTPASWVRAPMACRWVGLTPDGLQDHVVPVISAPGTAPAPKVRVVGSPVTVDIISPVPTPAVGYDQKRMSCAMAVATQPQT